MNKTIEDAFIDRISTALPLFERKVNAHRFQCPYCQASGRNSRGKILAPSDAKGYFYPVGNAWNFKCHKCGEHQSFEKFLESQFPLLHFDYVCQREQLGTTGYQTNCSSLETVLKKRGMIENAPVFRSDQFQQQLERPISPPAAPSTSDSPKITKLLPMRSPQQQAGCQSQINHRIKLRDRQRRKRSGELW
jgi:hypothetical protein